MLPKARAGLEMGGRGQGTGAGLAAGLGPGAQGTPRWQLPLMACVGEAEPRFPGQGSKQVELVANYRGSQHVPREASWAGPGW